MRAAHLLAAGLLAGAGVGLAQAAPEFAQCDPLQVLYTGASGSSYSLQCRLGPWRTQYAGVLPRESESKQSAYRLTIAGERGVVLTELRTLQAASVSSLSALLAREVVLLDDGTLALKACPDAACTRYRPLKTGAALQDVSDELTALRAANQRLAAGLEEARAQAARARAEADAARHQALVDRALASVGAQPEAPLVPPSTALASEQPEFAALREALGAAQAALAQARQEQAQALAAVEATRAELAALKTQLARQKTASAKAVRRAQLAERALANLRTPPPEHEAK